MKSVSLAVACLAAALQGVDGSASPVIGIVGVPYSEGCDTLMTGNEHLHGLGKSQTVGFSCMTNFYAKWVQQSVARTVGITYDMHDTAPELLTSLLDGLNGILFTGGGLRITDADPPQPVQAYMRTLSHIYNTSVAKAKGGVNFPVWGTCMGMQTISILGSGGNKSVLETGVFDSEDLSLPVTPTVDVLRSRMFRVMPDDVFKSLTQGNSTANLHHDGVTPRDFYENLGTSFLLLGTSVDRNNKEFVAMIEHQVAPIYAVQFHPERPQYEWTTGHNFNRSAPAVAAMRFLSDFFVSEAMQNSQALSGAAAQYAEDHATSGMDSHVVYGSRVNFSRVFTFTQG